MTTSTATGVTIRDTLAALRAKHARALSLPVPGPDQSPAPMQPAQDGTAPAPRTNARSVPHRPQEVRWTTICRMLDKHGAMTATQLAPLLGMSAQYTGRNLHRMRLAGLVAIADKTVRATMGRPTYHYDLAERVLVTPPVGLSKWAREVIELAAERRAITRLDVVAQRLATGPNTANRRLRLLAKLGLLEVVSVDTTRRDRPQKSYGPALKDPRPCPSE